MSRIERFTTLAILVATCGAPAGAHATDARRWIVSQPAELRDLYLDGELTDARGNRWSVAIVPGIRPPARRSREGFQAARADLAQWTAPEFWRRRRHEFHDGIRFAVDDAGRRLVVEGIEHDWRTAGARVAELTEEKPFGWLAELAWYTTTGYVVSPLGRLALGTAGATGGLLCAGAVPALGTAKPAGTAVTRAAAQGVALPAALLAIHQPAYLLAITTPEPLERHDGRFGLRIISRGGAASAPRRPAVVGG